MSTYVNVHARVHNLRKVDAKRPLKIQVSHGDIAKAKKKNSKECAFAKACKRTESGLKAAYFFRSTAWLEYENRIVRYMLPTSVQKEIVSFDRSSTMEPGVYHLSPPTANRTLKRYRETRHLRPWSTGRDTHAKPRMTHRTTNVRTLFAPQDI